MYSTSISKTYCQKPLVKLYWMSTQDAKHFRVIKKTVSCQNDLTHKKRKLKLKYPIMLSIFLTKCYCKCVSMQIYNEELDDAVFHFISNVWLVQNYKHDRLFDLFGWHNIHSSIWFVSKAVWSKQRSMLITVYWWYI